MDGMRRRLHALLDPDSPVHAASRVRAGLNLLVLVGLLAVSLATSAALSTASILAAKAGASLIAALFAVEHAVRVWIAPEIPHLRTATDSAARARWVLSARGLIGFGAAVPVVTIAIGEGRLPAVAAMAFVILFVLKLASQTQGLDLIARVVRKERPALTTAAMLFLIILITAASLAHALEGRAQPETFGSIPKSLWWAMVTLTTTGYGDVVPHTLAGRLLAGAVMISGFAVLALLAGILATGFSDEIKRSEFVRIWDLVARVPFLSEAGAITISNIVARLRSRTYPAGAVVIRRGAPGDCMYFLVTGVVEVAVVPNPVRLSGGAFFGEMALLDRTPRSADVITATPCTMLVLDVADFYQIASLQPGLLASIEAEARRRQAENEAGGGTGL